MGLDVKSKARPNNKCWTIQYVGCMLDDIGGGGQTGEVSTELMLDDRNVLHQFHTTHTCTLSMLSM